MTASLIPLFIETAARLFLLALLVWAGLRLLGAGDVFAQKAAWGLVLAAAFVMPFLGRSQSLPVPAFRLNGFQLSQQARFDTGSGNIRATRLRSGFKAQTGSGDIRVH